MVGSATSILFTRDKNLFVELHFENLWPQNFLELYFVAFTYIFVLQNTAGCRVGPYYGENYFLHLGKGTYEEAIKNCEANNGIIPLYSTSVARMDAIKYGAISVASMPASKLVTILCIIFCVCDTRADSSN